MVKLFVQPNSCAPNVERIPVIDPSAKIHASAIVHPNAVIGANVEIGAFTCIDDEVEIGEGTWVSSHVVIKGPTKIGRNNKIYQFASIGEDCLYLYGRWFGYCRKPMEWKLWKDLTNEEKPPKAKIPEKYLDI